MPLVIPVAHDFTCPWCWIALSQTKRLREAFDVEFDWRAYELWPEKLPFPEPSAPKPADPKRPATPSRLELAYAAELMIKPTVKHGWMRTNQAHQALEYAKSIGQQDAMLDRLYEAHWVAGDNIDDLETLLKLGEGIVPDRDDLKAAIAEKRFQDRIVEFDDDAYAAGVFNVPTYWIGGERYAEQPYSVLAEAINRALDE